MNENSSRTSHSNLWAAFCSLLVAAGTVLACVLPGLLLAVGAGALLSALTDTIPALIWLAAHKTIVYAVAGVALVYAAVLQWQARSQPLPDDPALARKIRRTQRVASVTYDVALATYLIGGCVAGVLPYFF